VNGRRVDVTTGDRAVWRYHSGFDAGHPDRRSTCGWVRLRDWAPAPRGRGPTVSGDENGTGPTSADRAGAEQRGRISGLAPNVTLLAIRTADADGSSYLSDVSAAIRRDRQCARVINLSLGGTSSTRSQQTRSQRDRARVVVVAAAGNEYKEGNPTSYRPRIRA